MLKGRQKANNNPNLNHDPLNILIDLRMTWEGEVASILFHE